MHDMWSSFTRWLSDPFGRRELEEKHSKLLTEVTETKKELRRVTRRYDRGFPISRTVGNPNLRDGRSDYVKAH